MMHSFKTDRAHCYSYRAYTEP